MLIVSTAKMSDKHQQRLTTTYTNHRWMFYDRIEEVSEEAFQEVQILITYGEDLTPETIDRMPQLQWIQVISAGLELMPFERLLERGILVTNARGIHRIPMAEYTMGMMLQLARNHYGFYDCQKQGVWDRSLRVGEVYGQTLGIVGLGAIGDEIAKRAKAFGMKVIGLRRRVTEDTPEYIDEIVGMEQREKLFRESDFLVILLPHTPQTNGLVGEQELQWMKPSAYLINIARGHVLDEQALLRALEEKRLAGAVLDVYQQEPLPADHPFWKTEGLILTPHISGRSPHYMQRALDIFEHNLSVYPEQALMRNVIDGKQGY